MKREKKRDDFKCKKLRKLTHLSSNMFRIINKVWGLNIFIFYFTCIKNSCFFVWENKSYYSTYQKKKKMLSKLPNFYLCMQHVLQATKQKAAKVPFFRETFMGNKNSTETSC